MTTTFLLAPVIDHTGSVAAAWLNWAWLGGLKHKPLEDAILYNYLKYQIM